MRLFAITFCALLATPLAAFAQDLPPGPGADLVIKTCINCHGLDTVTSARNSPDGWRSVVSSMIDNGASLSDKEAADVVNYLATNYGFGPPPDPAAAAAAPAAAPAPDAAAPAAAPAAATPPAKASFPHNRMPVSSLQHVNIRCADAQRSRDFYVLMGLREGDRPPFDSQGHWMYAGAEPVVHLVQKKPGEKRLGPGTGELDHVALGANNLKAMRAMLTARGIPFQEAIVPRDGSVQLFINDPDGVQLELNFPRSGRLKQLTSHYRHRARFEPDANQGSA